MKTTKIKTTACTITFLLLMAAMCVVYLVVTTKPAMQAVVVPVAEAQAEATPTTTVQVAPAVQVVDTNLVRVRVAKLSFASGSRPLGHSNNAVTNNTGNK